MKYLIKEYIKKKKKLYKFYTDIRYRKLAKIRNWVLDNQKFITNNQLNSFIFYKDRTYVRVWDNVEFLYIPELLGGLLGLEKESGFETKEVDYAMLQIKDGYTIFDIGANFGLYSILMAKKYRNVKIHSFEPVHSTFNIFKHNISHNGVSQSIVANKCGLGDKVENMLITTDKYSGNHLIIGENTKDDTVQVPIITLDSYVKKNHIDKVNFIKCDIEGAELLMLKGAISTLKRDHPDILIEISNSWTQRLGYTSIDVVNFLTDLGYHYQIFANSGSLVAGSTDITDDVNIGSNFYFSK